MRLGPGATPASSLARVHQDLGERADGAGRTLWFHKQVEEREHGFGLEDDRPSGGQCTVADCGKCDSPFGIDWGTSAGLLVPCSTD